MIFEMTKKAACFAKMMIDRILERYRLHSIIRLIRVRDHFLKRGKMVVRATRESLDLCQFHEWYPIFEPYTIKSLILDLNEDFIMYLKEDGIILPHSVDKYMNQDQLSDDEDLKSVSTKSIPNKREFSEFDNKVKQALEKFNGELFIKLNWSAPRDAAWINNESLKCRSLHDVYVLLKSSDRVVFDLEQMYDLCETTEKRGPDKVTLVLRKWANLQPSMEFRLFIKNHAPIGLCQRETTTYFDFLKSAIGSISNRICRFYEVSLQGKLPLSDYALDVYVDKKDRVWVIDVNPFGDPTSPLLFDWEELLILPTFTIRIVENEDEKMTSTLGRSRGPVDVHLAPDFSDFLAICKQQATEFHLNDSDSETEA